MKILKYKNDGNTVEVINKTLTQANGNVYYYEDMDKSWNDCKHYHYFLKCNNDVCYPLTDARYNPISTATFETWKSKNENAVFEFLEKEIEQNHYINNLQILFCELQGNTELANRCKEQKAKVLKEREEERKQEETERKAREEQEEKNRLEQEQKDLEQAYTSIKTKNELSATQFEKLCNDLHINLPIKFIGWLREFCGTIYIKQRNREEIIKKYGYYPNFTYQFETTYYYTKGHRSTSLAKYADMLAEKVFA